MSTAAEFDTYTPRPRYECTRGGVYHIGIKTDKEGNPSETPPVLLSDPIRLIGRGTDARAAITASSNGKTASRARPNKPPPTKRRERRRNGMPKSGNTSQATAAYALQSVRH